MTGRVPHGIESIEDARGLQEITKPEWSAMVRSAIERQLRQHGTYCSNDLEDALAVPDEHRNVIGAQTNAVATRGLMRRVGWTTAVRTTRHGGEVKTYEITLKGREQLGDPITGVGAGAPPFAASSDPGDRTITPLEPLSARHTGDDPAALTPAVGSTSEPEPEPEQVQLVLLPDSHTDHYADEDQQRKAA